MKSIKKVIRDMFKVKEALFAGAESLVLYKDYSIFVQETRYGWSASISCPDESLVVWVVSKDRDCAVAKIKMYVDTWEVIGVKPCRV